MEQSEGSKIKARLGKDRKKTVAALVAVALFVVAFFLIVIFFGMYAANPWGEAPGPGP